ncbi:MAG: glutamate 5-kinase, partial [Polynucleobacter sp.]
MKRTISESKRIVVKVGSTLVTNNGAGLDRNAIATWAEQVSTLLKQGCQVLMVSSGAIAEGMQRLAWTQRPQEIHQLQAAAAVG